MEISLRAKRGTSHVFNIIKYFSRGLVRLVTDNPNYAHL